MCGVERRLAVSTDSTMAPQAADVDVAENAFVTICGVSRGRNGTMLRIVTGLDVQSAREVLLQGRRISGRAPTGNDSAEH